MVEGKDILNFLIVILLFFFLTLKERNIIFIFKFIIFFKQKMFSSLHAAENRKENSLSWSKGVICETSEAVGEKVWTDPFQSSGSEGPEFLFFP